MISCRAATVPDVPAVVALIEGAYRGDSSRAGWTTEADLIDGRRTDADAVSALIRPPASVVIITEDNATPIGCYQLEHRPPAAAYFGMFCVRPDRQGAGLGSRMLADAERRAHQDWGAIELQMTVIRQRTDLISWYERRGYRRTEQTAPFPYGDERVGRPVRPDLEFVFLAKELGK